MEAFIIGVGSYYYWKKKSAGGQDLLSLMSSTRDSQVRREKALLLKKDVRVEASLEEEIIPDGVLGRQSKFRTENLRMVVAVAAANEVGREAGAWGGG